MGLIPAVAMGFVAFTVGLVYRIIGEMVLGQHRRREVGTVFLMCATFADGIYLMVSTFVMVGVMQEASLLVGCTMLASAAFGIYGFKLVKSCGEYLGKHLEALIVD